MAEPELCEGKRERGDRSGDRSVVADGGVADGGVADGC